MRLTSLCDSVCCRLKGSPRDVLASYWLGNMTVGRIICGLYTLFILATQSFFFFFIHYPKVYSFFNNTLSFCSVVDKIYHRKYSTDFTKARDSYVIVSQIVDIFLIILCLSVITQKSSAPVLPCLTYMTLILSGTLYDIAGNVCDGARARRVYQQNREQRICISG